MPQTSFQVGQIQLPAADLGPVSPLPPVAQIANGQQRARARLGEDDGLFVGYGFVPNPFPYRQQDGYGEELTPQQLDVVVLENRYLRAEFLPGWGGRLRSLIDKQQQRELLYANPVIRPRNLALRNAWLAGGVEWNCGLIGHSPHTSEPLFTARTQLADGTPVLRMYGFERIRQAVYQMDFFLPEDSRLLMARMRIVNPHRKVIPMYWWSNIAVRSQQQARVLVVADEAYTSLDDLVCKVPVPMHDGVDITYPLRISRSIDYFWRIRQGGRKMICHVDQEGYGLCQVSTNRLKGRKLFVWGNMQGSDTWQRYLSGQADDGKYVEIQAGLAHTQYECLPMPPQTAWEWLEGYGAIQVDPKAAHGPWQQATTAAEQQVAQLMEGPAMEAMLRDTHAMATSPAGPLLLTGDGWGALERLRMAKDGMEIMCPHLDFGTTGEEQAPWVSLLEQGTMPVLPASQPPQSWMIQPEWLERLRNALAGSQQNNPTAWLQLGAARLAGEAYEEAAQHLLRGLDLQPDNPWIMYCLGQSHLKAGRPEQAASWLLQAARTALQQPSLAAAALDSLLQLSKPQDALAFYATLPEAVQQAPRVQLQRAWALVLAGQLDEAEAALLALQVPDIREGEMAITDLWVALQQAKAKAGGPPFNPRTDLPPRDLDFRVREIED